MDRSSALRALEKLHTAQNLFHSGGPEEPLRQRLTYDVVWTVPGENAIAGRYEGIAEVMRYFRRRRNLASESFRIHPGDVLVGEGDRVAVLTDGTATLSGVETRWSTVGLYRLREDRVAACHLLPLDPAAFDEIWSG